MLALALSIAIVASLPAQAQTPAIAPQTTVSAPVELDAVDLEDVVVEGRRLEDATEDFVREVGAPARGRGLARWRDGVCVGVANLRNETAQYIADRISTVAEDLGLKAGEPGCQPSVLIIAAIDTNAFTEEFVAMRPRLFIVGGSGMDRGYSALAKFKTNDQAVRWWTVSVPVDSETGEVAVRLPGYDLPQTSTFAASRLSTQIVSDTKRSFVIIDVDKIEGVTMEQLSDYLAMVVLAQINPEAETASYATILNVFKHPDQTPGLTDWDKAYLEGLYRAERGRTNANAHSAEVADSIVRVRQRMNSEQDAAEAEAGPETPQR